MSSIFGKFVRICFALLFYVLCFFLIDVSSMEDQKTITISIHSIQNFIHSKCVARFFDTEIKMYY